MKKALKIFLCISCAVTSAQTDENQVYKKRVLETTEVDFLSSYYAQKGDNAAVTGGIGTEQLTDATAAIIISIPLNDDDVLSVNTSISAYTSASSSNGNPFDIYFNVYFFICLWWGFRYVCCSHRYGCPISRHFLRYRSFSCHVR